MKRLAILFLLAVLAQGGAPGTAHAYVDPGVGSYILQVVIGTVAAAGFGLKLFWKRIRHALQSRFSRHPGDRGSGA